MEKFLLLLLAGLIQSCNSKEVSCTTKQTHNLTCYIIPKTSASSCSFSWSNSTDHNLASDGEKVDQVVDFSNITVLVTYNCHERIIYSRTCLSEKRTTVTCIANCTTSSPQGPPPGPSPNHWIIVMIIAFIVLLLLAGAFILYQRRHRHAPVVGNKLA